MTVFCEARNGEPQIIYHAGYSMNAWHFKASAGLHFNTDSYRNKKFMGKKLHTSLRKCVKDFSWGWINTFLSAKFCLCLGILLVKQPLQTSRK